MNFSSNIEEEVIAEAHILFIKGAISEDGVMDSVGYLPLVLYTKGFRGIRCGWYSCEWREYPSVSSMPMTERLQCLFER